MQLQDKSGIGCDRCGLACKQDFTYYNFDFRKIDVYGTKPSLFNIIRLPVIKSLDICTDCFDKISRTVIENYKTYQQTSIVRCEISGQDIGAEKTYYFVDVQRAEVNTSRQPFICVTCKKHNSTGKQCTCGALQFVRPAKVQVTKDIIQFSVHQAVFTEWLVHKPKPSEWDTKS